MFKIITEANSFINITIKKDYEKGVNIKKYKTELEGINSDFCNAKKRFGKSNNGDIKPNV